MKLLFLGTDRFSALSLQSIFKNTKIPVGIDVITSNPGNHLGTLATSLNLPIHLVPPKTLRNWTIPSGSFDLAIVSSFGYFIPKRIINAVRMINIHPSLLPKNQGPAPLQYTILNGDTKTGVSIIDLHPEIIDAGNILLQKSIDIRNDLWYNELEETTAQLGGEMIAEILPNIEDIWKGKREQNCQIDEMILTRKIRKEDGILLFSEMDSNRIGCIIRAISHQEPIRALMKDDRQVILEGFQFNQPSCLSDVSAEPGTVYLHRPTKTLWIKSRNGGWLGVERLKIVGKSSVYSAPAFFGDQRIINYTHLFI